MRTADLILRWCELYTRGLSPAIAGDRRDELASDLWEHAAHEPRPAVAMLSRAIRGVPADLAWRYEESKRMRGLMPRSQRIVSGAVSTMVLAAASALIVFGVVVISRTSAMALRGEIRPFSDTAVWVIGLTALAVVGLLLLVRQRTRWLGAVVLAASSALVHFGLYDLINKSATIGAMIVSPMWSLAVACVIGALVLLFLSAALLWAPTRKALA